MTDPRIGPDRGSAPADPREDLQALREVTSRSIPALDDGMATLRTRRPAAPPWKERLMPVTDSIRRRPWLATAGVATAAVLVLSVVPVSYTRTVGHDVSVKLANVNDVASAAGIAAELKSMLKAGSVAVKAAEDGAGTTVTFEAFVPASAGVNAGARAQAVAKELTARGFAATAATAPRRERVSGSVYAFARDLVIRVEMEGKTAPQIEAEIRDQLAAAGVTNTVVSVKDEGDRREVMIRAEEHVPPGGEPQHRNVNVQLTKNGQPAGEDGARVELRKLKGADGVTLQLTVTADGRTTNLEVQRADTMSDADLAARIRAALQNAGLDLDVEVENGQPRITVRK